MCPGGGSAGFPAERDRIFEAFIRSVGRSMASNHRGTLMKVGERLFAQHGYRDVSIKEITSSAGLGTGSFYTYFPGKESFYSEILDAIEQRGAREVEKHVNSLRSPLFRLKALFRYATLSLRSNEILRGIYTGEKRYLYPGLEVRAQKGGGLLPRIEKLLGDILEVYGDIEVVLARELTKKFEEVLRQKVSAHIERFKTTKPRGEFIVII